MKHMMYARSYNVEIMIGEDKDEIIQTDIKQVWSYQ